MSDACQGSRFLQEEEQIRTRVDEDGIRWLKVYFGAGAHYRNWLNQCVEIYGWENILIEEVTNTGLSCFEDSEEKSCRIWVKDMREDETTLISE